LRRKALTAAPNATMQVGVTDRAMGAVHCATVVAERQGNKSARLVRLSRPWLKPEAALEMGNGV
jgi:hypothetical protein